MAVHCLSVDIACHGEKDGFLDKVFGAPRRLYPGEMNFPRFSGWFGANSSHGKQKRLLSELHTRMLSSSSFAADRCAGRHCGAGLYGLINMCR